MDVFFAHKDAYPVLMIIAIALAVAGPLTVASWLKARRAELELLLKRELAERGMSAAEICAVVEAGASRKTDADRASEQAPGAQHAGARRRVV
jgi:uncharacterized protein YgbK (DUF1537 family)